ncbi:MAG: MBL fold metallo-hydrolase, partial [Alphaproteobacteria bacterium]|nr:MBL fold metallo-hydrolase [Alphaproteobacteria bacterium]
MTTDPIPEKTRNSSLGASIVGASIVGAGIVGASIVGAQGRGTATILGSGTSGGVPTIFNDFGACDPSNPRNHRMRVSVHLSVPITDAVANARAHANETKDDSAGFNEASLSGASLDGVSLDGARLSGVSLDTPGAVANTAPRPLYGLGESSQATDEVARQAAPSKQAFVSYLIDTSPDLRRQCQLYGIRHVDGVFYTHDHADHVHGI